jgi:hypothetical protein
MERSARCHLLWWDAVIALKRKKQDVMTITPEFGPYPYMVHLPYTGKPVSDQWMSIIL